MKLIVDEIDVNLK